MDSISLATGIPVIGVIALGLHRLLFTATRRLPVPPGPTTSWFGQVDLPKLYPWLTYTRWKEIYGDIIYIHVFGNPILVLNSAAAASDLLDKRSGIYSSRPVRTMVVDLIGWDWLFSSMVYGNWWKQHRNLFHKYFRPIDASAHHLLQLQETHALLRNLLLSPDNFRHHVRRTAAAIILKITYGHRMAEGGDEYVALADKAVESLTKAGIFGTYLVDYIPILKYIPWWFPFASFQRQALKWRKDTEDMVNRPFSMVKEQIMAGAACSSLVAQELENRALGVDPANEQVIRNVAATSYAAGSDTVVSTILSFFLAMQIYPEVQEKAQQELDTLLVDRLPSPADRKQLPYIECICYELLRWNPVTPLGLAHYVSADDEYRGFRIPKGTTVLPNVWAILHDPNTYPDPAAFHPERYLDREKNAFAGINPLPDVAFGFGRRMCPGRWFAFDSIFIAIASILAVYDISPPTDENGALVVPTAEYTSTLLSHPTPFKCRLCPRSAIARSMIEETTEHL